MTLRTRPEVEEEKEAQVKAVLQALRNECEMWYPLRDARRYCGSCNMYAVFAFYAITSEPSGPHGPNWRYIDYRCVQCQHVRTVVDVYDP